MAATCRETTKITLKYTSVTFKYITVTKLKPDKLEWRILNQSSSKSIILSIKTTTMPKKGA